MSTPYFSYNRAKRVARDLFVNAPLLAISSKNMSEYKAFGGVCCYGSVKHVFFVSTRLNSEVIYSGNSPNFRKPQPQVLRTEQITKIRVIQRKITSLIRFTQRHEVSVADFYLTLGKSKSVSKSR